MKKEHLKFVIDSRCFRGSCITSMSDGIHCDYDGSTLEELKKQENNPFLIAVTRNTIHKKSRIYDRSLCRPFHEITEEDSFIELLQAVFSYAPVLQVLVLIQVLPVVRMIQADRLGNIIFP